MTLLFNRIRQARRGAEMSQSELAAAVGVARSAVAQWERKDGAKPTTDNMSKIAMATAVSFEWLATGRGGRWLGGETISARSYNLLDRMMSALDRSQYDVQFTAWGDMLLGFAAVVGLGYAATTAVLLWRSAEQAVPWILQALTKPIPQGRPREASGSR